VPARPAAVVDADQGNTSPSIPDSLPFLPLHGMVLLPMALLPMVVTTQRGVRAVDEAMGRERLLAMSQSSGEPGEPLTREQLANIGAVGVIHQLQRGPDGAVRILVQGVERIRVGELTGADELPMASIERMPDQPVSGVEIDALQHSVADTFRRLVELSDDIPNELAGAIQGLTDARQVAYLAASTMPATPAVRQELLELDPVEAKLRRALEVMQRELSVRELSRKITEDTRERMTKAQRDFFLREQVRAINKELGEDDSPELAELRRRIGEAGLSDEAKREANREMERLSTVPPASPEHGIIRTYLDVVASLPWSKLSGGEIDIAQARAVLDADHYDLEKVKERILEYLAVRKLRTERAAIQDAPADAGNRSAEPILCFVGPPGVGKTSLGQSIARALGRKFVRVSLGGIHDEAEIRGHRRTYVGAMPGRIIQGLRRAETRDPVFMLDEIDKVGADWRGDPSSALLEVLDPAQNATFVDNYLNVAFDLSQVLFVATANALDNVSPPLRDRMEVLQLSGYTDEEKVEIALRHLVDRQRAGHGLRPDEIDFDREAIRAIIRGWTREAGVRSLDREIGSVCRKVARSIAEGDQSPVSVTVDNLTSLLGRERFFDDVAERVDRPGVATGLAWTPVGGDVLYVEAAAMPAKQEQLLLTGMLGDVMRESAQAAMSYVRSLGAQPSQAIQIPADVFEGKSIHVHVPAGAIPKDGPSAGVTMLAALVSLATGRAVRSDVAMTGELTLRGKVLPVGGIKEKVLAAHRAGIRAVVLPRRNERDLDDLPADLRAEMTFVPVDTADEVLRAVLVDETAKPRSLHRRSKRVTTLAG
jgi:ATP-dependent Lon protease